MTLTHIPVGTVGTVSPATEPEGVGQGLPEIGPHQLQIGTTSPNVAGQWRMLQLLLLLLLLLHRLLRFLAFLSFHFFLLFRGFFGKMPGGRDQLLPAGFDHLFQLAIAIVVVVVAIVAGGRVAAVDSGAQAGGVAPSCGCLRRGSGGRGRNRGRGTSGP